MALAQISRKQQAHQRTNFAPDKNMQTTFGSYFHQFLVLTLGTTLNCAITGLIALRATSTFVRSLAEDDRHSANTKCQMLQWCNTRFGLPRDSGKHAGVTRSAWK